MKSYLADLELSSSKLSLSEITALIGHPPRALRRGADMAIKNKDARPDYWLDYSNLQQVKHRLIAQYLKGWFPKLGHWSGRILYLDTHAGRGRHETGEEGSPLVALTTFLAHNHKDQILRRSEVRFLFVEQDERNAEQLDREIAELGELPKRVSTDLTCGNCFEAIESVVNNLQATGRSMAPAFVFVDPYGFKVPGRLLRDLRAYPKTSRSNRSVQLK